MLRIKVIKLDKKKWAAHLADFDFEIKYRPGKIGSICPYFKDAKYFLINLKVSSTDNKKY